MTLTDLNDLSKEDLMYLVLEKHNQEQQKTILIDHLKQEIDHLKGLFLNAQRERFGKKSERDEVEGQLSLLGESENSEMKPSETANESQTETITYTRRKDRTPKDFSHLKRRYIDVNVPENERLCRCGKAMNPLGFEESEKVHLVPQVMEVWVYRCEKIGCSCKGGDSIRTAKMPKTAFPRLMVTEETLANIVINKVQNRQPLYHQAEQYQRKFAVDISRQTLARWFIQVAEVVQPLVNLIKDEILKYDAMWMDSTGFQVLKEPGRKAETESQAYCFMGGPPERRVVAYDYTPNQHKNILEEWLETFKGYSHCDAAVWYKFLENKNHYPDLELAYCHVHIRRKFEKLAKRNKPPGLAKEVMRIYKEIYKQERLAKDQKLNPDDRKAFRETYVRPLINTLKARLDAHAHLKDSPTELGKAIAYPLRRWDGFLTFFKDGRLEIDNNRCEQKIKDFVLSRKNFLFADTQDGADAVATLFSLVITAEI